MDPKVGLLPLYIELYDNVSPEARPRMDEFAGTIADALRARGIEVVAAPVCRLEREFRKAIGSFEDEGADAIVTLHLAYSPSLESAKALAETALPIIVLDTTPTYSYAPDQDPDELMYNHGIHGVQDMCNLLIRNGKPFEIEVGHWEKSDVLDRVASAARAARLASTMSRARVGRLGEAFKGMGDFSVDPDTLRDTIGVETVAVRPSHVGAFVPADNEPSVQEEIEADLARFDAPDMDADAHRRMVRAGLAVRRWIEEEDLTAFTFNFGSVDRSSGLPAVPFLEASKAMARGIGYAGEGDVLTAALVGSLLSMYPETTFTEMFCPDWEHETIFLSHMGEMNPDLADGKARLMKKHIGFLDPSDPVIALGRLKPGKAVLVNLAPGPDDSYSLIVASVEMMAPEVEDRMGEAVRGWFRPSRPIREFLANYSYIGGTHHSALVYGDVANEIARFGRMMDWEVYEL